MSMIQANIDDDIAFRFVDGVFGKRYVQLIKDYCKDYYKDQLGLSNWSYHIEKRLSLHEGRSRFRWVTRHVPMKDKVILDVGSGWGELLLYCFSHGISMQGIEPDPALVEISMLGSRAMGLPISLCRGVGERLPFKDNSFWYYHTMF